MNMWARISGQYHLRRPQQEALERTQRLCDIFNLQGETPAIEDFLNLLNAELNRGVDNGIHFPFSFPTFCNAIATGVGKTRLMAANIDLISSMTDIRDFIILTPGRTVLNKLIGDFNPASPSWIFRGINRFNSNPPTLVTADNYPGIASFAERSSDNVRIHLLTIQSIQARNAEDRRMLRLNENIGVSYFDWLQSHETVCFMDEAHHYRSSSRVGTINSLNCRVGFGMTATPWDTRRRFFRNIVYNYPLSQAISDGYVRRPGIVTLQGLNPEEYERDELERLMIEHGFCVHENTREILDAYAEDNSLRRVKPFTLIVCRDIDHANNILSVVQNPEFRGGYYNGRTALIHSGASSRESDVNVESLLEIENPDNPIEVVIHVNMLKEGWSVNNLFTIIPLRPGESRILVEQTIGRGTRLPYGRITGNHDIDSVKVMAHDRFDEIIEAAQEVNLELTLEEVQEIPTVEITSIDSNVVEGDQDAIVQRISQRLSGIQSVDGDEQTSDEDSEGNNQESDEDVEACVNHILENLILVPRFRRVNSGEQSITLTSDPILDLSDFIIPEDIVLLERSIISDGVIRRTSLTTSEVDSINPQLVIIQQLANVSWIDISEMRTTIIPLIAQMIEHVNQQLGDSTSAMITSRPQHFSRPIIQALQESTEVSQETDSHVQMITYGHPPTISRSLRHRVDVPPLNLATDPPDGVKIQHVVFTGLRKSVYPQSKFDSRPELIMARNLNDDPAILHWVRPCSTDIKIPWGGRTYEPDFLAETESHKYIIEPKRDDLIDSEEVLLKEQAAHVWCADANEVEAEQEDGKPWRYILIPGSIITAATTLQVLWEDHRTRKFPSGEPFNQV
jgi:type III restriction enzyme